MAPDDPDRIDDQDAESPAPLSEDVGNGGEPSAKDHDDTAVPVDDEIGSGPSVPGNRDDG